MLAGVIGGIAALRLELDRAAHRLRRAVGRPWPRSRILVYLIPWLLMPEEGARNSIRAPYAAGARHTRWTLPEHRARPGRGRDRHRLQRARARATAVRCSYRWPWGRRARLALHPYRRFAGRPASHAQRADTWRGNCRPSSPITNARTSTGTWRWARCSCRCTCCAAGVSVRKPLRTRGRPLCARRGGWWPNGRTRALPTNGRAECAALVAKAFGRAGKGRSVEENRSTARGFPRRRRNGRNRWQQGSSRAGATRFDWALGISRMRRWVPEVGLEPTRF